MRTVILAAILLLIASCNSGVDESGTTDTSKINRNLPGNSGGSDIIGRDTARMDTSMQTTPASH